MATFQIVEAPRRRARVRSRIVEGTAVAAAIGIVAVPASAAWSIPAGNAPRATKTSSSKPRRGPTTPSSGTA